MRWPCQGLFDGRRLEDWMGFARTCRLSRIYVGHLSVREHRLRADSRRANCNRRAQQKKSIKEHSITRAYQSSDSYRSTVVLIFNIFLVFDAVREKDGRSAPRYSTCLQPMQQCIAIACRHHIFLQNGLCKDTSPLYSTVFTSSTAMFLARSLHFAL